MARQQTRNGQFVGRRLAAWAMGLALLPLVAAAETPIAAAPAPAKQPTGRGFVWGAAIGGGSHSFPGGEGPRHRCQPDHQGSTVFVRLLRACDPEREGGRGGRCSSRRRVRRSAPGERGHGRLLDACRIRVEPPRRAAREGGTRGRLREGQHQPGRRRVRRALLARVVGSGSRPARPSAISPWPRATARDLSGLHHGQRLPGSSRRLGRSQDSMDVRSRRPVTAASATTVSRPTR